MRHTKPLEVYNEDELIGQCAAAKVWTRREMEEWRVPLYTFIGDEVELTAFLIDCFGIEPEHVGDFLTQERLHDASF